jgi:hypothetical protein
MPDYSSIQKEETFKAAIFRDFFSSSKYAYEPNIGNIDFIVTEAKTLKGNVWKRHYLWAESKKGIADIPSMLTQLVLTIKKTYEKGEHLPPPYIACFDTAKIAFVPFHDILPIFKDNDVNWNVTPSNHTTDDFLKTKTKVENLSNKNIVIFNFETDKQEIINFINNNLIAGNITSKFQINKNNFVIIYTKWLEKVKPSIAIDWDAAKKQDILDCDFFLADVMSQENITFKDGLFVLLVNTQYKFDKKFDDIGFSLYKEVGFRDNQKAHKEFWDKYERPPLNEYWDYIVERRELLVPQDIRERKGSFFTPQIWVQKSQEYLAAALGENWQDEYYVWDCAAGTGNLLAGLTNKYNIWASTLDQADVDVMHDRIKNGANLLADHVFKFDFLNDEFDKLPKGLKAIIDDPEKQKKLVIYINPPYAEAASKQTVNNTGQNKTGVSTETKIHERCKLIAGSAARQLSAQFFFRIITDISNCNLAIFSSLRLLAGKNFVKMREIWQAIFISGFIVPANTFDNVSGAFPIGFHIWQLISNTKFPELLTFDIFNENSIYISKKYYSSINNPIVNWLRLYFDKTSNPIGSLRIKGSDFQNNQYISISVNPSQNDIVQCTYTYITPKNLPEISIYFTIRQIIPHTWLNHDDQYYSPDNSYKNDILFINNCIIYSLFDDKNTVKSKDGVNHWIPFSETEINAKNNFESHFMYDYINGKIDTADKDVLFNDVKKNKKLQFSDEAQTVLNAGRELWKYYHAQPSCNPNASLYDIREFFQGRDNRGKMKNKSGDETYNTLIGELRTALQALALKIQPKVYEYGFLLE